MTNRFYRDKGKGMIAGVCAGLADYFGVSPALLRLIFVLLALGGGPGVIVYIVLWIILPEKQSAAASRQEAVRENVRQIGAEARGLGQELQNLFGGKGEAGTTPASRIMLLGGLLVLMGLFFLADSLHLFGWLRLDEVLWPLVLILAGIVLLNRALRK